MKQTSFLKINPADSVVVCLQAIPAGTLLEIGYGKILPDSIPEILEAKHRPCAGPTAPACGLCLIEVDYN